MRVSIEYPDFHPGTRVWVDGVEITRQCQAADDEAGMAWGLDLNDKGRAYLVTDPETGEQDIARKVWRGEVRIEVPGVA